MKKPRASYVSFEKSMKNSYTILAPDMLPRHFLLISRILGNFGYRIELLKGCGDRVRDLGLKYVHNDTCYPALLVIGQFIDALQSGKYDVHKTALILTQTGGGCRASNYIYLLRKALKKAGFGFVPVISLNLKGLEKHPGFKLSLPLIYRTMYGVFCGDLLMSLVNQTRPYERVPGSAEALADSWTERLAAELSEMKNLRYSNIKKKYALIVKDFAALDMTDQIKPKVGIVGEIYVKYSPMANNHLEDFLVSEGAQPVVPGLLDFCMYCVYNNVVDADVYGIAPLLKPVNRFALRYLEKKQRDLSAAICSEPRFFALSPFSETLKLCDGFIDRRVKMGEGWLLSAEMLELSHAGINNVVCAQPFGCLPNHICGKGVAKQITEERPGMNVVAVDYDPGATQVNQENRLKLMLAAAFRQINQTIGKE